MEIKSIYKKFNIEKNSDVEFAIFEITGINRSRQQFSDISQQQLKRFFKIYKRIKNGEPIDLIFKKSYFFDECFFVNKHVLKPRQDTEFVCEQAIKEINYGDEVLDLCCGSGVIGITLIKKCGCKVVFSDVSRKALKVCCVNLKKHNLKSTIIRSDLFKNIEHKFDCIVCNPPYIKTKDIDYLEKNVKNYDPILALDGGDDGLNFYRKIIDKATLFLKSNGKLIFEIGYNQGDEVSKLMQNQFNVCVKKDYNNNDRCIIGELKNGKTN